MMVKVSLPVQASSLLPKCSSKLTPKQPLTSLPEIGIHTVDNLNNVLMEITEHKFPRYAF